MSDISVRRYREADLESVYAIDRDSSTGKPWNAKQWGLILSEDNVFMNVATLKGQVVGFIVYRNFPLSTEVLNLAVHKEFRRQGIASALLSKEIVKLEKFVKDKIFLMVRETNYPMQCLLRKFSIKCVNVARNYYEDTDEDGFFFQLVNVVRELESAEQLYEE
jgi:[ribosomal protein S18]-alanine N-acetyltransferase